MQGSFTAYDASPSGRPAPTSSFLSVVGRGTFQMADWGLGRHPPRVALSSLGTVARIPRATREPAGTVVSSRLTSRRPVCRRRTET